MQPESHISRRRFMRTGAAVLVTLFLWHFDAMATAVRRISPAPLRRRLKARPGSVTREAPPGLSRLGLGDSRDGTLYVPTRLSRGRPAPLLVALHGGGGSCRQWESYGPRAEARGLIVLAPDSRGETWDGALGRFGPDLDFLDAALQYTFECCRIDPRRIALGGFSDGASYTLSLGVSNGDLFTHLIAHSPGFFAPDEPIVGTPRVFVSHGTRDSVLPVSRSRSAIVPTFREAGYDVVYREFEGDHELPGFIAEASLDWLLEPT